MYQVQKNISHRTVTADHGNQFIFRISLEVFSADANDHLIQEAIEQECLVVIARLTLGPRA